MSVTGVLEAASAVTALAPMSLAVSELAVSKDTADKPGTVKETVVAFAFVNAA